eukprot:8368996-Lingulodinium_polyedra.AAC.1
MGYRMMPDAAGAFGTLAAAAAQVASTDKTRQDYWRTKGYMALSVHLPRLRKCTPIMKTLMPGAEKPSDPLLHRLGEARTMIACFDDDCKRGVMGSDVWIRARDDEMIGDTNSVPTNGNVCVRHSVQPGSTCFSPMGSMGRPDLSRLEATWCVTVRRNDGSMNVVVDNWVTHELAWG